MAINLSLNELRTKGRHLQTQLDNLAPSTPEFQVVQQEYQVNQATIRAVGQAIRDFGIGLTH